MKIIKKYYKLIAFLASRKPLVIGALSVALIVYFLKYFITGEFNHVLWVFYWAASGGFGFILSFLAWRARQRHLNNTLVNSLDGSTKKTYKIYATGGVLLAN